MNTQERIAIYTRQNGSGKLTPRQRRRAAKKAGTDPLALVVRDDGMGCAPGRQGYRDLVSLSRPVSGIPATNAWVDEVVSSQ